MVRFTYTSSTLSLIPASCHHKPMNDKGSAQAKFLN